MAADTSRARSLDDDDDEVEYSHDHYEELNEIEEMFRNDGAVGPTQFHGTQPEPQQTASDLFDWPSASSASSGGANVANTPLSGAEVSSPASQLTSASLGSSLDRYTMPGSYDFDDDSVDAIQGSSNLNSHSSYNGYQALSNSWRGYPLAQRQHTAPLHPVPLALSSRSWGPSQPSAGYTSHPGESTAAQQMNMTLPQYPVALPSRSVSEFTSTHLSSTHLTSGRTPWWVPPVDSSAGPSTVPSTVPSTSSSQLSLSNLIERTTAPDYSNPRYDEWKQAAMGTNGGYHDNAQDIQELLSNIRPDVEVPPENREGTPPALNASLYPHQQLALQWMKEMEDGTNKGGILADDMGLGKTVSSLSLIISRPSDNVKVKVSEVYFC